jgi:hypothetical protein
MSTFCSKYRVKAGRSGFVQLLCIRHLWLHVLVRIGCAQSDNSDCRDRFDIWAHSKTYVTCLDARRRACNRYQEGAVDFHQPLGHAGCWCAAQAAARATVLLCTSHRSDHYQRILFWNVLSTGRSWICIISQIRVSFQMRENKCSPTMQTPIIFSAVAFVVCVLCAIYTLCAEYGGYVPLGPSLYDLWDCDTAD